ncbi:MAG: PHB depolymerase family esterase [Brumimicrobium sp.]
MFRVKFLILFLGLFLFVNCNKEFKGEGKVKRYTLKFDGEKRVFRVYTPDNYDESKSYPMVMALHGRLGNGRQMMKSSKFNPIADQKDVIMVYPNGYKKSWNDGRGEGPAYDDNIDDVGFINALINRVTGDFSVDGSKVYVCGMSNGGFMSMRLAHELNNKIAAFGTVTGSLGSNYNYNLSKEVPVMLIAGTEDPLVPYTGGEVADSDTYSRGFEELFHYFGNNNGCNNQLIEELPEKENDGIRAEKWTYETCDNNASCILFKIIGAGHTWPSGDDSLNENTVGKESSEINASEELVNFFLQHSL